MDSKAKDDEKTLNMDSKAKYGKEALDMLLKLQQRVDEIHSELQSSGASATTSSDIQNIYNEIQQLLQMITKKTPQDPSKVSSHIRDGINSDPKTWKLCLISSFSYLKVFVFCRS